MLAIAGIPPLPVQEALTAFYPLCTKGCVKKGMAPGHTDGWGISGFNDGRAVYFGRQAESAAANASDFREAAGRAAQSKTPLLVAHFRKASDGDVGTSNTHPFHYQDWVFAHNGTVFGAIASFPLISAAPTGTTDSERFFLWLYEQIYTEEDPTHALAVLLKKRRHELVYTSLNFLMTDGTRLWAYRDFGEKRLDKDETVHDRELYYTLYFALLPSCAVFCSEPLESVSAKWSSMSQRTLAIVTPRVPIPQIIKI